jgi:serine/threonine protein kinase
LGEAADEVLAELTRDQLEGEVMLKTFNILEQLGQGSFGQVFKVNKKGTDTLYALKVLSKQMLLKHNQLKYALSELKILKSMDFPFIVKLFSRFQTPKSLYLILEYCPNGDLSSQIQAKEVLSQEEARFYTAEILLAIDFIHSKGVAYRDLKPENVLLDAEGHIRLTDFGLAKDGLASNAVTKSFCGSPAYLAPEMLLKKGSGQPADIYGLGAVLYELLVGKPPYFSEDVPTLFSNIKLGRLTFPWNVTAEAKDLLCRLLARDPSARPTTKQVMQHVFFRGIDWGAALGKRLQPPAFVPREIYEEEDAVLRKVIKDKDYSERPTMEECLLDFD